MRATSMGLLSAVLLTTAWVLSVIAPTITAVVAGNLTARAVQSQVVDLLRITLLPERTLVWGLVAAALHRVRLLLAMLIALMPAQIVGMLQLGIAVTAIFYTVSAMYNAVLPRSILEDTFVVAATAGGVWSMNLLAAVLGTGLALRFRRGGAAVVAVAAGATLLGTVILLVLVLALAGVSVWPLAVGALATPYLLAALAARMAVGWVKAAMS
jgi:hypothetical protein